MAVTISSVSVRFTREIRNETAPCIRSQFASQTSLDIERIKSC